MCVFNWCWKLYLCPRHWNLHYQNSITQNLFFGWHVASPHKVEINYKRIRWILFTCILIMPNPLIIWLNHCLLRLWKRIIIELICCAKWFKYWWKTETVVLEFNQYTVGSRWRRTMINKRDHREEGNEEDGFYGGIRKLSCKEEIAMWTRLWPSSNLE